MTGNDFKAWRDRAGYSQSQAADALDIPLFTLQKWERRVNALRELPQRADLAIQVHDAKQAKRAVA